MATLRDIRQHIYNIKSIQEITQSMKMVATVKLSRAQNDVVSARPYTNKLKELLQHLSGKVDITENPLFAVRPLKSVALVIVTSDRGLCGAFNSNIIRAAVNHIQTNYADLIPADKVNLICIGKKGFDFFQKNNYKVVDKRLGIFQELKFNHAQDVITEIVGRFLAGEYDRVEIVYNEFKSIVQQRLVIEQILPIQTDLTNPKSEIRNHSTTLMTGPISFINYIYEPSGQAIIEALIPKHLNFQLWRALLESYAAEQGARRTAMDNATTNASKTLKELQLFYNKARQASITKELLEIVSGAEALRNA